MKKLFVVLLAVIFASGVSFAQDGKKDYREAKRSLSSFALDPTNNKADLKEAKNAILSALEDPEMQSDADTWNLKGEIYNEIANQIVAVSQFGVGTLEGLPEVDGNPALIASEAYKMGLEKADKNSRVRDALEGMVVTQGNLNNLGITDFDNQEYQKAFEAFNEVLELHKILKENGEEGESSLAKEEDYHNQLYIAGLAALNSGNASAAKSMFQALYDIQYDKPAIYEAMYQIAVQEGESRESAYKYLETGRKEFPEDVSLLFAEINHFLNIQQLDVLITKLEQAIAKEPDNVTLYTTMGSVYDNLHQRAFEAGETERADEYFAKAKDYYEQALEKDEDFFDAIYSIGALYYNKAAALTQELQALAEDYSAEGIKKYEAKRNEVFGQFDKALPYFKRCEKLQPGDPNTLIALKEIYAKKDDLEMSNIFKERLEKVQAGEKIEKSYFNE